jgi:hypothetical protein
LSSQFSVTTCTAAAVETSTAISSTATAGNSQKVHD